MAIFPHFEFEKQSKHNLNSSREKMFMESGVSFSLSKASRSLKKIKELMQKSFFATEPNYIKNFEA